MCQPTSEDIKLYIINIVIIVVIMVSVAVKHHEIRRRRQYLRSLHGQLFHSTVYTTLWYQSKTTHSRCNGIRARVDRLLGLNGWKL